MSVKVGRAKGVSCYQQLYQIIDSRKERRISTDRDARTFLPPSSVVVSTPSDKHWWQRSLVVYDSIADPTRFPRMSRFSEFVPCVIPMAVLSLAPGKEFAEIVCGHGGKKSFNRYRVFVQVRM